MACNQSNFEALRISSTGHSDGTSLTKAEKKRLAAERFATSGKTVPPRREKLTKAERRTLQEAQRAVKTSDLLEGASSSSKPGIESRARSTNKPSGIASMPPSKQTTWFSHLPQYEERSSSSMKIGFSTSELHPSIISLGLRLANESISGSNKCCIGMLRSLQRVVLDFNPSADKLFSRELDEHLRPLIKVITECRSPTWGMQNAIRMVRHLIANLTPELDDAGAKAIISREIDEFIQNRILLALKLTANLAKEKITAGDVILTYGREIVIEHLLKECFFERSSDFRVIIVDARPHLEGKKLLESLTRIGIQCTYVQINALAYIIKDVTKVFLGASAFMSNGVAVARCGTALVAMTAHNNNIPVLFCCETYNFSDRIHLDAVTHNELRNPEKLLSLTSPPDSARLHKSVSKQKHYDSQRLSVSEWRNIPNLEFVNFEHDITPKEFISVIVTELGMIPPSSVPAIIREYSKDGTRG
uniref:Translation initiation factor eIF2B subunit delta n=1 Tax=Albugo laibachii Nc14 TaxID=890382 RepID=F0WBN1_9STRA|nr:translation initiation factor eIF2B subunit delta pu [Albugo laibachii Nc14]|eukprot:CCA18558.1 translation initiation factor eIF2B subunit delta pu [Albugo laibachii Nc14]